MKGWKLIKKNGSPIFYIAIIFVCTTVIVSAGGKYNPWIKNLNSMEVVNLGATMLITLGIVPLSVYRNGKKKAQENFLELKKIKDEVANDIENFKKDVNFKK